MAPRILACLILVACSTIQAESPKFTYYPVNTTYADSGNTVSGLRFYFVNPPAPHATVIATVTDCGKDHQVAGEIDTDDTHGDTMIHFAIGSLDGFAVKSTSVTYHN